MTTSEPEEEVTTSSPKEIEVGVDDIDSIQQGSRSAQISFALLSLVVHAVRDFF
jgi:hypothetical protein